MFNWRWAEFIPHPVVTADWRVLHYKIPSIPFHFLAYFFLKFMQVCIQFNRLTSPLIHNFLQDIPNWIIVQVWWGYFAVVKVSISSHNRMGTNSAHLSSTIVKAAYNCLNRLLCIFFCILTYSTILLSVLVNTTCQSCTTNWSGEVWLHIVMNELTCY